MANFTILSNSNWSDTFHIASPSSSVEPPTLHLFIYPTNPSWILSERTSERVLYLHFVFSPSEGEKKDRRQVPLIWYDTFFAFTEIPVIGDLSRRLNLHD